MDDLLRRKVPLLLLHYCSTLPVLLFLLFTTLLNKRCCKGKASFCCPHTHTHTHTPLKLKLPLSKVGAGKRNLLVVVVVVVLLLLLMVMPVY